MSSLLYFLIFAGLFAFMMRFGCGSHVMGHGSRHSPQDKTQPGLDRETTAKDPVCGMTVDTARAETAVHAGRAYYFCSTACRDRFVASPEKYIGDAEKRTDGKEISHASHQH